MSRKNNNCNAKSSEKNLNKRIKRCCQKIDKMRWENNKNKKEYEKEKDNLFSRLDKKLSEISEIISRFVDDPESEKSRFKNNYYDYNEYDEEDDNGDNEYRYYIEDSKDEDFSSFDSFAGNRSNESEDEKFYNDYKYDYSKNKLEYKNICSDLQDLQVCLR